MEIRKCFTKNIFLRKVFETMDYQYAVILEVNGLTQNQYAVILEVNGNLNENVCTVQMNFVENILRINIKEIQSA